MMLAPSPPSPVLLRGYSYAGVVRPPCLAQLRLSSKDRESLGHVAWNKIFEKRKVDAEKRRLFDIANAIQ
jgi:hypothetical protein